MSVNFSRLGDKNCLKRKNRERKREKERERERVLNGILI